MLFIRKRLPWLIVGWVSLQAVLVVAPVALYAAQLHAEDASCDCPDEMPGAQCPMHSSATDRHDDEARCRMRSSALPGDAALLVVTVSAPPVAMTEVHSDSTTFETIGSVTTVVASRSHLPDPPPPRL